MQDRGSREHEAHPPSYSPSPPLSPNRSTSTLPSLYRSYQSYLTEDEFRHFTETGRRRVLRNLQRVTAQSYSNQPPHRESLYDWAAVGRTGREDEVNADEDEHPGGNDDDDGADRPSDTSFPRQMLRALPQADEQSDDASPRFPYHRRRRMRTIIAPEQHERTARTDGDTLSFWAEDLPDASGEGRRSLSATRALLQSVERHRRFNERARESMQGFILDRTRVSHDSESGRRSTGNEAWTASTTLGRLTARQRERELPRPAVKADDNNGFGCDFTKVVTAMSYLSDLRNCGTRAQAEIMAAKFLAGQSLSSSTDQVLEQLPNLVLETQSITRPQFSSWLTPGSTLTGFQQSSPEAPAIMLNRDRDYLRRMVANRNLSSAHLPGSISTLMDAERYMSDILNESSASSRASDLSTLPAISVRHHNGVSASAHRLRDCQTADKWPVSVTLHSVDLSRLTLTGTMSAHHIPDKLSPTSPDHRSEGTSMESFFDGEIIDFNQHTLETTNFRTDSMATDVEYWRQIGPFREVCDRWGDDDVKEAELAKSLTDRSWLNKLGREWILMRWKERCFTTTSSQSWGLTISGFYYVAMRRQTGEIEGLYYDLGSQPYQQLSLMPKGNKAEEGVRGCVKREFWAMEMR